MTRGGGLAGQETMARMERALAGRYVLEKVLGEGGMAAVWRARDSRLDRPVAVKLMAERFAGDPEFRARFLQEARAAASFSHPNVVDVLDYGEEEGVPYIVMELVEGEDLRSLLQRRGKLHPEEVARIGADVSRGLAAAHRRGLVHRDIKPANILIAEDGTPKLTDFGIVRALGSATLTRAGMTLGSVHYLSPEQVEGADVDARSDLYSLGVVLYEAATAQRPFDGDAPAAVAVQRLSEVPRPPHTVEPTVPRWLSSVIERAMARDPRYRYASAADLERDLRARREAGARADASDATVAMPVPVATGRAPAVPRPRAARRRRADNAALFFLGLLVALALIGGGVFLLAAPETVAVPNVEGKPLADAVRHIEAAGLRAVDRCCEFSDKEFGHVARQEPAAGTLLRPGETVTIFMSGGQRPVIVPSLRGMTVQGATKALQDAGLKLRSTEERFDEIVPLGRVIESVPNAGASVPRGFEVTLIVSAGPRPTPTPTPSPTPTPTLSPTPTPTPSPTPAPTSPPPPTPVLTPPLPTPTQRP